MTLALRTSLKEYGDSLPLTIRRRACENGRRGGSPATTLDQKAAKDPFRAIEEDLEQGGKLKTSCHVFQHRYPNLEQAARYFGLSYELVRYDVESNIMGQEAAVKAEMLKLWAANDQARRERERIARARREEEAANERKAQEEKQFSKHFSWKLWRRPTGTLRAPGSSTAMNSPKT